MRNRICVGLGSSKVGLALLQDTGQPRLPAGPGGVCLSVATHPINISAQRGEAYKVLSVPGPALPPPCRLAELWVLGVHCWERGPAAYQGEWVCAADAHVPS